MKIAIMQPYFFPYLGYFSLMKHTDRFVLFDTVQFIRHGWIERNRMLKQNEGWLYIQVPLIKAGRETKISEMRVDNRQDWAAKIIAQIQPYKKTAPYFRQTQQLLEDSITGNFEDIVSLNRYTLKAVCNYLGLTCNMDVFSEMNLSIEPATAPDEWALNICKSLGNIEEYWNPPGGLTFFDRSKYANAGIDLKFQAMELRPYDQKRPDFLPGLSILDVMMFNSPAEIMEMLDNYTFI